MNILHSTTDWLALTKSWIYDQIRFMPEDVEQTVWCDRLIDGPQTEWHGRIWVCYPTIFERIFYKINRFSWHPLPIYGRCNNFSEFDIVFSHFGYRAWRDYQYVKGRAIKKVVRFYGCDIGVSPKQPGWLDLYKKIFDEYDLLICEGPYMAKELESLSAPREKIKWLHLGIDPALLTKDVSPTEELIDPLCILIAGTFTEKKGIEYALEGVLQFIRENRQKVKLTLVGDANPYAKDQLETKYRISQIIEQLRKEKNIEVIQTGYISLSTLITLMQKNLLFISPSVTAKNGDIEGGFPVTLTHAAAQGMILIGTDHCDLPEIVRDRQNGFICRQNSSSDVFEMLKMISKMNLIDTNAMRNRSVEIVRCEFDQVKLGYELRNMFNGLMGHSVSPRAL